MSGEDECSASSKLHLEDTAQECVGKGRFGVGKNNIKSKTNKQVVILRKQNKCILLALGYLDFFACIFSLFLW